MVFYKLYVASWSHQQRGLCCPSNFHTIHEDSTLILSAAIRCSALILTKLNLNLPTVHQLETVLLANAHFNRATEAKLFTAGFYLPGLPACLSLYVLVTLLVTFVCV